MLFAANRRFYVELADTTDSASNYNLHISNIPPSRVQYQCISRDGVSVRMYLEVEDALRPEDVGGFFANLANTPVQCTLIRSQKRCRRVWSTLMRRALTTESGRHNFIMVQPRKQPGQSSPPPAVVTEWAAAPSPKPSAAADPRLLVERTRLLRRLAEPPMPVAVELERDSPDVALACARDAFDDLKRRMLAMDVVLQHRTFVLHNLRSRFAACRARAEMALGVPIGGWESWTILPQDETLQTEVNALRSRLQRVEAEYEEAACCEGAAEYQQTRRLYSPSGLRAVLWDQHAALTAVDRQIGRGEEACRTLKEQYCCEAD